MIRALVIIAVVISLVVPHGTGGEISSHGHAGMAVPHVHAHGASAGTDHDDELSVAFDCGGISASHCLIALTASDAFVPLHFDPVVSGHASVDTAFHQDRSLAFDPPPPRG